MLKRVLVATCLAALAFLIPQQPVVQAESPVKSWNVVRASLVSCGSCITCSGGVQHKNLTGSTVDNPHSVCRGDGTYTCLDGHPPCGVSSRPSIKEEALRELVVAALDGDAVASSTLVTKFPDRAKVNRERGAIQVSSSCNPLAVIAHIPVDSNLLATLVVQRGHVAAHQQVTCSSIGT